jgi:hypothetical protein
MLSRAAVGLVAVWLASPVSAAETLERVLGVVDERPVFLSEVRAVESLDRVSRKDALERVIDEVLLFREANRLPQATTPPGPETGGTPAVQRTLARRAAIRRYAEFRFRPQVRIDEEAVRKAYRERWEGAAEPPVFAAVAAELREQLMTQAVDLRMAAWIKDLRAAARIRYNALD